MQQAGARKLREDSHRTRRRPALELVEPPPPGQRRTITITGHPVKTPRRRPARSSQLVAAPDRMALYAFLLGIFLIVMAIATAHA
jgi:hypothetical protein